MVSRTGNHAFLGNKDIPILAVNSNSCGVLIFNKEFTLRCCNGVNGVNSFAASLRLSVLRTQMQNSQMVCVRQAGECPQDRGPDPGGRNAPSEGVHSIDSLEYCVR